MRGGGRRAGEEEGGRKILDNNFTAISCSALVPTRNALSPDRKSSQNTVL